VQFRQVIRLTGTLKVEDVSPAAEAELLQAFRGWRDGP